MWRPLPRGDTAASRDGPHRSHVPRLEPGRRSYNAPRVKPALHKKDDSRRASQRRGRRTEDRHDGHRQAPFAPERHIGHCSRSPGGRYTRRREHAATSLECVMLRRGIDARYAYFPGYEYDTGGRCAYRRTHRERARASERTRNRTVKRRTAHRAGTRQRPLPRSDALALAGRSATL